MNKLFRNIFSLTALQGVNFLLTISVFPYLIRTLGATTWGKVCAVQIVINYFIWFVNWGFYQSATRQTAVYLNKPRRKSVIFIKTMAAQFVLLCVSICVLSVLVNFVPYLSKHSFLYYSAIGMVIGTFLQPLWFVYAHEMFVVSSSVQIASKIISLPFIFCIKEQQDSYLYYIGNSVGMVLSGIVLLLWLYYKFKVQIKFCRWRHVLQSLNEGYHLFLSEFWAALSSNLIPFMLSIVMGPTALGFYSVADRIKGAIIQLMHPITHALFPRICHLTYHDKAQAKHLLFRFGGFIGGMTFMLSLLIYFNASLVIYWVGGEGYNQSEFILKILSPTIFIISASEFLIYQMLVPRGYKKVIKRSKYFAFILVGGLCYPFIYYWGGAGAASLSLMTELFIFAALSLSVFTNKKNKQELSSETI